MKKVLVIAFIFPPLGGSGVQRTLNFVKYLPEFAWQPYVVCSDDPHVFGDGLDPTLLAEIPASVKVWRRPLVNPLGYRRRLQKFLGLEPRGQIAHSAAGSSQAAQPEGFAADWLRRLFRVLTLPLAPFEFPPVDPALYWSLAILPGCLKIIRQERIDLIYTTSFPYSDHLTGCLLKRLTGRPWVADFRDPWSGNPGARSTGWRFHIDRRLEKLVLQSADRVVGVTPSYTRDLHRLASRRPAGDFITIENGYDPLDFTAGTSPAIAAERPQKAPRPVVLAHVGRLYNGTALSFLEALAQLEPGERELVCRFTGGLAPVESAWLEDHPLPIQVQSLPRQSHARALAEMRSSGFLLLFALGENGRSGHYPGKLFEYMASGTPILLVGPQGDAADLLIRSGTGIFVPAGDRGAVLDLLRRLTADPPAFRARCYHPKTEVIAAYNRRALTGKLAGVFDDLEVHPAYRPFTRQTRTGPEEKAGN